MSCDDWQAGDLALCVSHAFAPNSVSLGWRPELGGIYTVREVALFWDNGLSLDFEEDTCFDPDFGFESHLFRKIRPHAPDAEDAETIRLLNGLPAQVPA